MVTYKIYFLPNSSQSRNMIGSDFVMTLEFVSPRKEGDIIRVSLPTHLQKTDHRQAVHPEWPKVKVWKVDFVLDDFGEEESNSETVAYVSPLHQPQGFPPPRYRDGKGG